MGSLHNTPSDRVFFFFLSVRYLSSVPSMKEKLVSLSTPDHTHGHTQPGTWRWTCLFNLPPTVRQKERILQDPSDKFQQCNELDCNNSEHLESVRGHLAWVKYYRLVHSRAPGHGCRCSRVVFFSSSTRHSARIENKAERASWIGTQILCSMGPKAVAVIFRPPKWPWPEVRKERKGNKNSIIPSKLQQTHEEE